MCRSKNGYIYIYKLIVGTCNDFVKIGKTSNVGNNKDRLTQHKRTAYSNFVGYCDFLTGNIIATKFLVKDMNECDRSIKNLTLLKDKQISSIEVYNVEYDTAVELIYSHLKDNEQLLEFIEDGYSKYAFIDNEKVKKEDFEKMKVLLLNKYGEELPEELLLMLRDKREYITDCNSHYSTGNYIDFGDAHILDLHFNRAKRKEILGKLKVFMKEEV